MKTRRCIRVFVLFIVLALAAVLIWLYAYRNRKSLDNIPSLEQVQLYIDSETPEQLKGYKRDQLIEIWGEPDFSFSGMFGDGWHVFDGKDSVIVYYDSKVKVETVRFEAVMDAVVVELETASFLIEPCEDEWERQSSDRIQLSMNDLPEGVQEKLSVGNRIRVVYDGCVQETYPAQLARVYDIVIEENN